MLAWHAIGPAWWIIGDSVGYVRDALTFQPETWRPSGYSLLVLWPLIPFHQLALVTALQHVMGLAAGTLVYAALLRLGLPRWAAAVAAIPALLDGYILGSEQMLASEPLFGLLVTGAIALLLWRFERRPALAVAGAGLLLGLAATTRIVGLPLVAVALLVLLVRRAGWPRVALAGAAFAVPVVGYASWFAFLYGDLNLTASSGVFMYGRTTQFVDCARVRFTSAALRRLCPTEPIGQRNESFYVFDSRSPIGRANLGARGDDALAGQFAIEVIRAQPGDYAVQVLDGLWTSFQWDLGSQPVDVGFQLHELMDDEARQEGIAYQGSDPGPFYDPLPVGLLAAYQRVLWVPGTPLLLALAVAVAGLAFGRDPDGRGLRSAVLLSAGMAAALLLVPAMTAIAAPRYRIPAIPALCVAAALGVTLLVNRWREARYAGALATPTTCQPNRL